MKVYFLSVLFGLASQYASMACAGQKTIAKNGSLNSAGTSSIKAPTGYPVSINSTQYLLAQLIKQNAIELNIKEQEYGCSSAMPVHGAKVTIGDYLAFLAASLDLKDGRSGVSSSCENIEPLKLFSCKVMFLTAQGTGNPWSYGLKFDIDSEGKIDSKKISCPGGS